MGFDETQPSDAAGLRNALRRMSHAKRTELTTLIGFAEMLADPERDLPCETRIEYGRIIHRAAANILAGEAEGIAQEAEIVERLEAYLDKG